MKISYFLRVIINRSPAKVIKEIEFAVYNPGFEPIDEEFG